MRRLTLTLLVLLAALPATAAMIPSSRSVAVVRAADWRARQVAAFRAAACRLAARRAMAPQPVPVRSPRQPSAVWRDSR